MRSRLHGQEKLDIRIYWNIGPISSNGEEEYDLRFVLFSGWVAGLKIFLDMRDHVSCLVNIGAVVVHAE
jgi:hypothetical protein